MTLRFRSAARSLLAPLVILVIGFGSVMPAHGVADFVDVAAESAPALDGAPDAVVASALPAVIAGAVATAPPGNERARSVQLGPPPVPPPES